MPYKIKHVGSGEKVTTPNHPHGFSKKPLSHKKAVAQLRAIKMNTHEALTDAAQIVGSLIEQCGALPPRRKKPLTAKPKACYTGAGMHVVGGAGGLARGGMGA